MPSVSDKWLKDVRRNLPVLAHCHYFNTGSAGPLPLPVSRALTEAFQEEVYFGRLGSEVWAKTARAVAEIQSRMGRLVHADPRSIALTRHTTDGLNIAMLGRRWKPGDEILLTSVEHLGGQAPAYLTRLRDGVQLREVPVGVGGEDLPERIREAIGPRTRAVLVSHVAYATGATTSLAPVVEAAHAQNLLVIVDGAQAAGAVPIDVTATGVDYYALPAQKWLLGPEGIGALYVRPELMDETLPTAAGYSSLASQGGTLSFVLHPDARRFHVGTTFRPATLAFAAGLKWLEEEVGWSEVFCRVLKVGASIRAILTQHPNITILSPEASPSGLIVFTVASRSPDAVVEDAARRGIMIRSVPGGAIRASAGWFLDDGDLAAWARWVATL